MPYVHQRLDSTLELCRAFPNEDLCLRTYWTDTKFTHIAWLWEQHDLLYMLFDTYTQNHFSHTRSGKKRTAARWPHYMYDPWRHCIPRDHRLSSPASLVMPIGDPRDGFLYPTLTLMMDSYSRLIFLHLKRRSHGWGFNSPIPTIKIEYKNTDINTGYIFTHISLEF